MEVRKMTNFDLLFLCNDEMTRLKNCFVQNFTIEQCNWGGMYGAGLSEIKFHISGMAGEHEISLGSPERFEVIKRIDAYKDLKEQ